jgi:hypothetical protein
MQGPYGLEQIAGGDRPHPLREIEAPRPGVNQVQPIELQELKGCSHRQSHMRCVGSLDLEPMAPIAGHDQEIQLGSGVRGPEEALAPASAEPANQLTEDEALPARP